MDTKEYYHLIRNSVKLIHAELKSIKSIKRSNEFSNDDDVEIRLQRRVEIIDEETAEIYLRAVVGFVKEGPFLFDVIYKGICLSVNEEMDEDIFKVYAYEQIVPLLLAYVRECIASTMARMDLPVFLIPTMDVLASVAENIEEDEEDL